MPGCSKETISQVKKRLQPRRSAGRILSKCNYLVCCKDQIEKWKQERKQAAERFIKGRDRRKTKGLCLEKYCCLSEASRLGFGSRLHSSSPASQHHDRGVAPGWPCRGLPVSWRNWKFSISNHLLHLNTTNLFFNKIVWPLPWRRHFCCSETVKKSNSLLLVLLLLLFKYLS